MTTKENWRQNRYVQVFPVLSISAYDKSGDTFWQTRATLRSFPRKEKKKEFNNEVGNIFFYEEKRGDNDIMTLNIKLIPKGEKRNFNNYSRIQHFPFNYFHTQVFFYHLSVLCSLFQIHKKIYIIISMNSSQIGAGAYLNLMSTLP